MVQYDIEPFDNCVHDCTCTRKNQTFKMYGYGIRFILLILLP